MPLNVAWLLASGGLMGFLHTTILRVYREWAEKENI